METKLPTIHIASDHAGFEVKNYIKDSLADLGYTVMDHGADILNTNDDYPDYIHPSAKAVAKDSSSFGIILGGSGTGEMICANKVLGIRAGEYYGGNLEIVKLMRQHNNANMLSLGARFLTNTEAMQAVELFLQTEFTGNERHVRRLNKIENK